MAVAARLDIAHRRKHLVALDGAANFNEVNAMRKLFPKNIRKIFVVAPAGPAPTEKTRRVAGWLRRMGYEVTLGDSVAAEGPFSYLAAPPGLRACDLLAAWGDPTVDLVISLRGGYGSAQLIPLMDWKTLKAVKKPFIGYSDLTALHLAMHSMGVGTLISGPMFSQLAELDGDPYTTQSLFLSLEDERAPVRLKPPDGAKSFVPIKKGRVEGPVIPVTLSVLSSMLGTGFVPDFKGAILLVEDIAEPVYKLDRFFTQLRIAGVLGKLSGLLLGDFKRCGQVGERKRLLKQVAEWVDGPVVSGIPFGHCHPQNQRGFRLSRHD